MKIETIFTINTTACGSYRVLTDAEVSLAKNEEEGLTVRVLVLQIQRALLTQYGVKADFVRLIMSRAEWVEWIGYPEGFEFAQLAAKVKSMPRAALLAQWLEINEVLWSE